uniref:Uncharacterized protein n=1 Tax=Oryza nivara TaxID=4536 RepID=A0A0E0HJ36_ORYNI
MLHMTRSRRQPGSRCSAAKGEVVTAAAALGQEERWTAAAAIGRDQAGVEQKVVVADVVGGSGGGGPCGLGEPHQELTTTNPVVVASTPQQKSRPKGINNQKNDDLEHQDDATKRREDIRMKSILELSKWNIVHANTDREEYRQV